MIHRNHHSFRDQIKRKNIKDKQKDSWSESVIFKQSQVKQKN